uniref:hypothetical protein n=1 Tax=Shewanella sp. TaxID=50422 RepID=UPI00404898B1
MAQVFQQRLSGYILDVAPHISRRSLAIVPERLKMSLISQILNLVLAEQIKSGDLLFLRINFRLATVLK